MNFVEGDLYCPGFLAPNVETTRTDLKWGLLGRFTPPIFRSTRRELLRWNLRSYLKFMSDEGEVDHLARKHIKSGEELPQGRFVLSEPLAQCQSKGYLTSQFRFLRHRDAQFYIDGDIGFGLGYQ